MTRAASTHPRLTTFGPPPPRTKPFPSPVPRSTVMERAITTAAMEAALVAEATRPKGTEEEEEEGAEKEEAEGEEATD